MHFMGLTSDGGVHSSLDHLYALVDIAKEKGVANAYIHCFMDGRDTDPRSGKGFIEELTRKCEGTPPVSPPSSDVTTPWTATSLGARQSGL